MTYPGLPWALVNPGSIPCPSGEGAGLIELLLGVQEDMIEAVVGQGHRLGLAIRGRAPGPPARRGSDRTAAAILQRPDGAPIPRRCGTGPIPFQQRQGRREPGARGLVVERGAGAVLPPVHAVPGGELVGERPELGAVEGAELQQAAAAAAGEDLLAGQRCGEAELRAARRAGKLHRRARRRRLGLVHGLDGGCCAARVSRFKQAREKNSAQVSPIKDRPISWATQLCA